jgi:pimeloyl-ACP methyl ester carboxylesterase
MDLACIGDSGTRSGRRDNDVFPPEALDDIATAIELIRSRYGIDDIALAGLCSGASHALRAAVAGLPVRRILMINPQVYSWGDDGVTLDELQRLSEAARNPGVYRKKVFSAAYWQRLVTGKVRIWRIPRVYVDRTLLALKSSLRNVARTLGIRLSNDLGRELEEVVGRGVRVVFLFARGEPGLDLLKIQAGSSIRRLGEHCRVHIVDHADHTFSRSGTSAILKTVLSDELFAPLRPRTGVVSVPAAGANSPASLGS